MAGGDPLSIGVSGLLAFQRALGTTSQNISNANTPGYSRQRVDLVTRAPQFSGSGFVGQGVTTGGINRIIDESINRQVVTSTSAFNQQEAFLTLPVELIIYSLMKYRA